MNQEQIVLHYPQKSGMKPHMQLGSSQKQEDMSEPMLIKTLHLNDADIMKTIKKLTNEVYIEQKKNR